MDAYKRLLLNNRKWAEDTVKEGPRVLQQTIGTAEAGVPLDRLQRQPRTCG